MPNSHRILVVEDDDLMRESVGRMLGKGDFAVNLAGDAEQARAVLEKEAIDLILLDWMLPGGETGIQFNEWLKQQPRVGWIPVVMMTSRSEDADVLLGFASRGALSAQTPVWVSGRRCSPHFCSGEAHPVYRRHRHHHLHFPPVSGGPQ